MPTEKTEGGLVRALLSQQGKELVDLLVVGDVVLRKHTLYLLEIPLRDSRHLVNLFFRFSNVLVLTVRAVYAKPVSIIIASAVLGFTFSTFKAAVALLSRIVFGLVIVVLETCFTLGEKILTKVLVSRPRRNRKRN